MTSEFFYDILAELSAGTWITIKLLFVAAVFGNLLAVPIALARVSHNPLLWAPSYLYILVMRGTPLLAQLYLVYYGLGSLFPGIPEIRNSVLWPYLREGFFYAVLALVLNTAGYSAEILRGAIQAVPRGEIEAGRAFGMSKRLILRRHPDQPAHLQRRDDLAAKGDGAGLHGRHHRRPRRRAAPALRMAANLSAAHRCSNHLYRPHLRHHAALLLGRAAAEPRPSSAEAIGYRHRRSGQIDGRQPLRRLPLVSPSSSYLW
jgi:His/Glu/Gln/Arg/opine family amino acid ABC transporter permease subunit